MEYKHVKPPKTRDWLKDHKPVFMMDENAPSRDITMLDLATNFAGAVARFIGSGFKIADEEVYKMRQATCNACNLWKPDARMGLGRCSHPACGCTRLKILSKAERCPLKKW